MHRCRISYGSADEACNTAGRAQAAFQTTMKIVIRNNLGVLVPDLATHVGSANTNTNSDNGSEVDGGVGGSLVVVMRK